LPAGVLFLSTFKKPLGARRAFHAVVILSREFGSKIAARGYGVGAWAGFITNNDPCFRNQVDDIF
jgi:hypothetical protein